MKIVAHKPYEPPKTVKKWYTFHGTSMNVTSVLEKVQQSGCTPFQIIERKVPYGFNNNFDTYYDVVAFKEEPEKPKIGYSPGGYIKAGTIDADMIHTNSIQVTRVPKF